VTINPLAGRSSGNTDPGARREPVTSAMIADMLANATYLGINSATAATATAATACVPRSLVCETAGVLDFVEMVEGAEVARVGFPLTAGINVQGNIVRITRFTGTNLWMIL
jgi:hypothetical protein